MLPTLYQFGKMFFCAAAIILTSLWTIRFLQSKNRRARLPPGPPKLFLVGNLLQMPVSEPWITYGRWGQEYGSDIIHLEAAGQSIMVVNSYQVASDLFEKRSSLYSSRPNAIMISELMGWDWLMGFMKYGKEWRDSRKLFTKHLSPSNNGMHQYYESKYIPRLLQQLLKKPGGFVDHLRHMAGATMLSLAYGMEVQLENDPFIAIAEKALAGLVTAAVPGAFLVDTIPILKYVPQWFPGADFQRKAACWREWMNELLNVPFAQAEKLLANGAITPSFAETSLRSIDEAGDVNAQKKTIRETAATIFSGGADTTLSAFETMVLAMVMNPEIQERAQEELDRVIGADRLPSHTDKDNLPYISAIVKEVLRWNPVTPLAIPHLSTQDDVYDGYDIPKDSIVIGNAWAMLHDEADYPDPFTFKPERFLTRDGKLDPTVRDPSMIAFGFGRRICPARHIALSMLWITTTSLLSTFNLRKFADERGNTIEPTGEYGSDFVRHPLPFQCNIAPRSEAARDLIASL